MLWVWGEPWGDGAWTRRSGSRFLMRVEGGTPSLSVVDGLLTLMVKPRRGPPTKKMTIKQAAESHKRHLEKAAARTKKWREKKGESNG